MDTVRYAKSLIDRFGRDARKYAELKANNFEAVGDVQEAAIWYDIAVTIAELTSEAPRKSS